jgi:phosphopantetheinyl transferase (holo-ACP synthase)
VAGADEFHREYPFHRVFHSQELQHALRLAGGDLEQASALLWSVKEAVVKALGCAFHLVDPRHITVYQSVGRDGEYTFPVGLSGKALERFPLDANHSLWVRSLPRIKEWLSIALLTGRAQQAPRLQGGGLHLATSMRRLAEILNTGSQYWQNVEP